MLKPKSKARRLIGSRSFYKMTLGLLIPVIIQNGLTNFVNLIDNIMIGRVGTEQMSGVAISNQLIFVFSLFIFGAVSGAGIFTAQFHGSGDVKGVRDTFRFKFIICALISAVCIAIFLLWGRPLISLYLSEGDASGDAAATLRFGQSYMRLMLIGLLPHALTQVYSSTARETGETRLPMAATVIAIVVNCSFNYVLIFGKLGIPALGVRGAAIATVISRFAELGFIALVTHLKPGKFKYIVGAYSSLRVPGSIARGIIIKGTPLTLNELLWAMSMAVLNQCYSVRGIAAIAGVNIASTVSNLFSVVYFSMGVTIAIIVGGELGAGKIEKAREDAPRLMAFAVFLAVGIAGIVAISAPYISLIYKTTDEVRAIATGLMRVSALMMPFYALTNSGYFTIRSGGNTVITFLFDSVFMWAVYVPLAFVLSRYTAIPIVPMYLCCQAPELIKATIGIILVRGGKWARNIVSDKSDAAAA